MAFDDPCDLHSFIYSQRKLRLAAQNSSSFPERSKLFASLSPFLIPSEIEYLTQVLNFASQVEYIHPGLSSLAYLKHPLRVATLITTYCPTAISLFSVSLAVLHNILETSTVTRGTLESHFGIKICSSIEALTVDRSNSSIAYKKHYYEEINMLGSEVCLVKIFDKFDNLFMLSFNPDYSIKQDYLNEIENHLYPLIHSHAPHMLQVFRSLVSYSRFEPTASKAHYG